MGKGTPGFKVLLQTWMRENVGATCCVVCVVVFAVVYLQRCYLDPDQATMEWMLHQTVTDGGSAQVAKPTGPVRLPSKYRMLNPLLLLVDYPICRFLTFDMKLKDMPMMSANLISIVHPMFAFVAAYIMVKAATRPQQPPQEVDVERQPDNEYDEFLKEETGVASKWMVKAAAFLFVIRNTLDTLDGVMARAQRAGQKIPTGIGFNGHLLDVVTDMTGVTVFLISVWYHFHKLRCRVERHAVPGIREVVNRLTKMGLSPLSTSRVLTFFGIAMICMTGLSWETTMLKMQFYFDSATNPDVLLVEKSPPVQICYFLWSLTCSDTLFFYLIVALFSGVAHDWLVFLSVYGWSWLVILTLYSASITRWIGNQPAMAAQKF